MRKVATYFGENVYNKKPSKNLTWKQLLKILIGKPIVINSVSDKVNHPYFTRGIIKKSRSNKNLKSCNLIILDVDQEPMPSPKKIHKFLKKQKIVHAVYNTATAGRSRIVLLVKPYDKADTIDITASAGEYLKANGLQVGWASESRTISQPWFTPQTTKGNAHQAYGLVKGTLFEFKVPAHSNVENDTLVDGERLAKSNTKHSPMRDFLTALKSGTIHTAALTFAGWRLRTSDLSLSQIKDEMDELIRESCSDESKTERWFSGESESILKHAEEHWEKEKEKEKEEYDGEVFTLKQLNKMTVQDDYIDGIGKEIFLYDNLVIKNHILALVGGSGTGKTAIMFQRVCPHMAKNGSKVYYFDLDSVVSDHKMMREVARKGGFEWINPNTFIGIKFSIKTSLNGLLISEDDLSDCVFVFDTLKKMVDLMSKTETKKFFELMRKLVGRGATCILLGHLNKQNERKEDIFEGTGDVKSDADELIYIKAKWEGELTTAWTVVDQDKGAKVRGLFRPIAFEINVKDRTVIDRENLDDLSTTGKMSDKDMSKAIKKAIVDSPGMTFTQLTTSVHDATIGCGWGVITIKKFINEIIMVDRGKNKYFYELGERGKRSYNYRDKKK